MMDKLVGIIMVGQDLGIVCPSAPLLNLIADECSLDCMEDQLFIGAPGRGQQSSFITISGQAMDDHPWRENGQTIF